jgi:hypothetical protein
MGLWAGVCAETSAANVTAKTATIALIFIIILTSNTES